MVEVKVARLSWKCSAQEFVLLPIIDILRENKLLGENNLYGAEDEIILFSGGPSSTLAKKSIIAGPPLKRYVARQPNSEELPKNNKHISPISGQIELGPNPPKLKWSKQTWSLSSSWNEIDELTGINIEECGMKFNSELPELTDEQKESEEFLPGQYCVAFAYDLVQWTQPWHMIYPPKEESILGIMWQIDRWVIHNREDNELELIGFEGDEWFTQASLLITNALEHKVENISWPSWNNKYNNSKEHSNHTDISHQKIVDRVKKAIKAGELYQLNFGRKWFGNLIMLRLLSTNPAPWSNWISVPDLKLAICSSSPELLLSAKNGKVTTRPIKGTKPRGITQNEDYENQNELISSIKERAEHLMLVDLERNDLGIVCKPGTVKRSEFQIESYADVHHLVSEIEGEMKNDISIWSAVQAIFPGGSITGCPKTVTVASIDELEEEPRSFWTGSIGYIDPRRSIAQLNILIRTLEATNLEDGSWFATVQAGGGLVIDSDSKTEVEEAKWKAAALRIATGWINGEDKSENKPNKLEIKKIDIEDNYWKKSKECGGISAWPNVIQTDNPLVLFVDNLDSFSWNIIHAFSQLGSDVCVINGRSKTPPQLSEILNKCKPSHIVIGPGPGNPEYSKLSMKFVKAALSRKLTNQGTPIPLLGVCLGHQAIGVASGMKLIENPNGAIHGVPCQISHDGSGLFQGLDLNIKMTRYHSLILKNQDTIPEIRVTARDVNNNSIMALQHNTLPIFGVQFHPESAESVNGFNIFNTFLEY